MPVCARAALLTPHNAFLTALVKATLPPHVVTALDEQLQASPSSLPVPPCQAVCPTGSLEGLTLGLVCGSGGGAAPQPPCIWCAYERCCCRAFPSMTPTRKGLIGGFAG